MSWEYETWRWDPNSDAGQDWQEGLIRAPPPYPTDISTSSCTDEGTKGTGSRIGEDSIKTLQGLIFLKDSVIFFKKYHVRNNFLWNLPFFFVAVLVHT